MVKRRRPVKRGRGRASKRARVTKRRSLRANTRNQLYAFKRFHYKALIGGVDGTNWSQGLTFALSDLTNYTEFTQLFDQYRIAGVKYRWVINRNPDYGGAVVGGVYNTVNQGVYPRVMWVHDMDSAGAPAGFAELQQYPKMKEVYLTPDKPSTRWYWIKPARLTVEYESAVNSAYRPTWKGFVDMASTDVPHHAIRAYGDGLSSNIQLRLECWYYVLCKNVR